MSRFTPWLIALALVACIAISLPAVADTWDAYTDFSSTANNPGPHNWNYGWTSTSDPSSGYTFTYYTKSDVNGGLSSWHENQGTPSNNEVGVRYPWLGKATSTYGRITGGGMSAFPPTTGWSILRWTAPAGISGVHTIIFPVVQNGAGCTVDVIRNPGASETIVFSGTSSIGYRQTAIFSPGDIYDFMFGPSATGWQYQNFSLKIVDGDYTQTGRVVDAEGHGLPGATVTVVGASPAYTVSTNSAGTYRLVLLPGSYNITASKSSYVTSANTPVTVTGTGGTISDLTIQRTGSWDLKADWGSVNFTGGAGNPNGQWSYGSSAGTALTGYTFQAYTYSGLGEWSCKVQYWGNASVSCGTTPPAPCVGYNTYSSALGAFTGYKLAAKNTAGNRSIARWTAPSSGWYNYTVTLLANTAIVKTSGSTYSTLASGAGTYMNALNLSAGDTLDFTEGATTATSAVIEAVVKSGAPGLTGYVEDANHVKIAGASVVNTGGSETTISDSAGNYTLIVSASGTYNIKASKAGYEAVTASVPVNGSTLASQNFTLPLGAVVSGTVTNVLPPYAAISGATVWTADGNYATTTNSAGFYSLRITRGRSYLSLAKTGFAPKAFTLDIAADTTQNASMTAGWDLASDMTSANPNGAWTYGYDLGTAGTFANMTGIGVDYAGVAGIMRSYMSDGANANGAVSFLKNTTTAPFIESSWLAGNPRLPSWREAQKIVSSPGFTFTGMTGTERPIARFTAPSAGYYTVSARFAADTSGSATTTKVALRKGASYLLGDPASDVKQLAGFAGKAQNGYTDSTSSASVYTYSSDMNVAAGDTIDAILYGGLGTGWVQTDLTITQIPTAITGHVTAYQTGSPIGGASVSATGAGNFSTVTDSTGGYTLVVSPGAYTVAVSATGYDPASASISIVARQIVTQDYALYRESISGTVTSDLPGHAPVANALVTITGGSVYTATTDANGYYAAVVVPGSYTVQITQPRYATANDSFAVSSGQLLTKNYTLHHSGTWDAAQEFSSAANPNGQWKYGYIDQAASNAFSMFTASGTGTPNNAAIALFHFNSTDVTQSGQPTVWNAQIGKNVGATPAAFDDWGAQPYYWYIEPGDMYLMTGDRNHLATIRWTAPDTRVVSFTGSFFMQDGIGGTQALAIVKNGNVVSNPTVTGFVGRAAVGYSDSFGAPTLPIAYKVAVAAGDVIDFVHDLGWQTGYGWSPGFGTNTFPWLVVGIKLQVTTDTSFNGAKMFGDGGSVSRTGLVVSKIFPDCIYIEAADRSSGMKVTSATASVGDIVDVAGNLGTTSDGERFLAATALTTSGTGSVLPVMMTNKDLGGGPYNFDPASGAGQRGVEDGAGLNNIGLLVKTTGKVTVVGDSFFYIDDGTHAKDASIFTGVRVWCPGGITMPTTGSQVAVTGISSIYNIGGRYFRGVRIGGSSDAQVQ